MARDCFGDLSVLGKSPALRDWHRQYDYTAGYQVVKKAAERAESAEARHPKKMYHLYSAWRIRLESGVQQKQGKCAAVVVKLTFSDDRVAFAVAPPRDCPDTGVVILAYCGLRFFRFAA